MKHPYTTTPELLAIAIAYTNKQMIADMVLPRMRVGKSAYEYSVYDMAEFNIPDTNVGRRGVPGEIEMGATRQSGIIKEQGLSHSIPWGDIEEAEEGYDPVARAVPLLQRNVALAREKRVVDLIQNVNNYHANNRVVVGAGDKWSDATSQPIHNLIDQMDDMFVRPNKMIVNRKSLSQLRRNPSVVKSYNGTAGDEGMVPVGFLVDTLELEIVVGEAYANTAALGQEATLARLWGNDCSLIYVAPEIGPNEGLTFGWTAQWGDRLVHTKELEAGDLGLDGGVKVTTGERVDEKVVAPEAGAIFKGVI